MVSAMWGGAWDIHQLDEVGSTNTYVREQARQGAPAGLVAVADHQTAGRGRLDRRWESPPGANLLVSFLLRPGCGAGEVHLCAGAVALAGADACREVAGVEPVLKWPNDLLLDGAKLAGVLAEAEFAGDRLKAVVVGIGINVAWPGPPDAGGTCLNDVGRVLAGEELVGRADAIDDAGRLVVATASGPRPVSAGDVVHLRPDQDPERARGLG